MTGPGPEAPHGEVHAPGAAITFVEEVMAEIDAEVAARRASGDLPPRVERELDELFLEFAPVAAGRRGEMSEALRRVDAAAFIDPVVPVGSTKSGGAAIKRTVRSLTLWYVNFVTMQVNQFSSAVSRALHVLEDRLQALEEEARRSRPTSGLVVEAAQVHQPAAPWVAEVAGALKDAPGRTLHLACGDGWLVRALVARGVDAYGVDPRPEPVERGEGQGLDLRCEEPVAHLAAVAPQGLGAAIVSGVVEPQGVEDLRRLLDLLAGALAPGGVLALHSMSATWWASDQAPAEAELVAGHPLRPVTWHHLLDQSGFDVAAGIQGGARRRARAEGPSDFLVLGRRRDDGRRRP